MIEYFVRVAPATIVICSFLLLLPRKLTEIRIVTYILLFVVFRDAMTPTGLWEISPNWILQFHGSPIELAFLGVISASLVFGINLFEPNLKKLLIYFRGSRSKGLVVGAASAILIGAPVILYYRSLPDNNVALSATSIGGILILALLGNFLEEVLFRGYLQGYLEQQTGLTWAAILSGVFFSAAHSSLATAVTPYAIPILGFTLYEGLVCGFVRKSFGVIPATVAHGGAIFLIASRIV